MQRDISSSFTWYINFTRLLSQTHSNPFDVHKQFGFYNLLFNIYRDRSEWIFIAPLMGQKINQTISLYLHISFHFHHSQVGNKQNELRSKRSLQSSLWKNSSIWLQTLSSFVEVISLKFMAKTNFPTNLQDLKQISPPFYKSDIEHCPLTTI